jgi:20S proteasome subunit alpha 6
VASAVEPRQDPEAAVEAVAEAGKADQFDATDDTQTVLDDDEPPGLSIQRDASFASTVPDDDAGSEKGVAELIANDGPGSPDTAEPTAAADDSTSLSGGTETSAATTATLVSANTSAAYGDISFASVSVSTRPDAKTAAPSANRLSISYADGSKRLLINADVVKTLKVFRAENRIEVQISLERTDGGDLKGILVRWPLPAHERTC